jgi:Mg-chelatase subunit ChlD
MIQVMFPNKKEVDLPKEIQDTDPRDDDSFNGLSSDERNILQSLIDEDKKAKDHASFANDAINTGNGSFIPDMMFEKITKNFSMANNLYGETILRQVTGYGSDYLEKNIQIPEFQKEIKSNIEQNIERLKSDQILNNDGSLSEKALSVASLVLLKQELDKISEDSLRGFRVNKKKSHYGEKSEVVDFRKGMRYNDISVKKSIRQSIRRGHDQILQNDLKAFERSSKGKICVIYAIDSSGSMNGRKIEMAKKAGIALAYDATEKKDLVGAVVFGSKIVQDVRPTSDFIRLLRTIAKARPSKKTDIANTLRYTIDMFPKGIDTKHLILLTDAMPNVGDKPHKETIEAVSYAKSSGVTISVIAIDLNLEGENLAKDIITISKGKLYRVHDIEKLDQIILQDYYEFS